jgi:hypothetical protein
LSESQREHEMILNGIKDLYQKNGYKQCEAAASVKSSNVAISLWATL